MNKSIELQRKEGLTMSNLVFIYKFSDTTLLYNCCTMWAVNSFPLSVWNDLGIPLSTFNQVFSTPSPDKTNSLLFLNLYTFFNWRVLYWQVQHNVDGGWCLDLLLRVAGSPPPRGLGHPRSGPPDILVYSAQVIL